jgi:hypothetical protein
VTRQIWPRHQLKFKFERNLTEESQNDITKTLDIPIEDVAESAVLSKDAEAFIGVAMKGAVARRGLVVPGVTRHRCRS